MRPLYLDHASTTPLLVLGSAVVEFGTIRTGTFGLRPVKITNGGRARLICALGAPEAPFSFLSGGGDFSLAPRKSKQIFIQFKPTEPGE